MWFETSCAPCVSSYKGNMSFLRHEHSSTPRLTASFPQPLILLQTTFNVRDRPVLSKTSFVNRLVTRILLERKGQGGGAISKITKYKSEFENGFFVVYLVHEMYFFHTKFAWQRITFWNFYLDFVSVFNFIGHFPAF